MEPYFPQRRHSHQLSTSLSYAKLSDVFDYNYLSLLHGAANENAITSDSDTDLEDHIEELASKPQYVLDGHAECLLSDSESDLEDYKIHLLTFKVNSNAQYTRPPRNRQSSSSDYFDFRPTQGQMAFLPTAQHPDSLNAKISSLGSSQILEQPEVELNRFLRACEYPLAGQKASGPNRSIKAAPFKNMIASDCFTVDRKGTPVSDIYELDHAYISLV